MPVTVVLTLAGRRIHVIQENSKENVIIRQEPAAHQATLSEAECEMADLAFALLHSGEGGHHLSGQQDWNTSIFQFQLSSTQNMTGQSIVLAGSTNMNIECTT